MKRRKALLSTMGLMGAVSFGVTPKDQNKNVMFVMGDKGKILFENPLIIRDNGIFIFNKVFGKA